MWNRMLSSLRPGADGPGTSPAPPPVDPPPPPDTATPPAPPAAATGPPATPTTTPPEAPRSPSPPSPPPPAQPRAASPPPPPPPEPPEGPAGARWKSPPSEVPPPQDSAAAPRVGPTVDPSAMVLASAVVEGNVTVGAECVCHPRCRIRAVDGPIVLGAGNVVEEFVEITNCSSAPMVIGSWNVFEVGCNIHAQTIGDSNVFEKQSRVEEGCVVGDGCVVGVRSTLPRGARLHRSVSVAGPEGHVFPLAAELSQMNQELAMDQVRLSKELLPAFHHLQFTE